MSSLPRPLVFIELYLQASSALFMRPRTPCLWYLH
uniref:Uncharacterized protein n=1 Tax=Anguilla anguilla TaxID=7936 RepID=A0A0E9WEQ2_ANGAN